MSLPPPKTTTGVMEVAGQVRSIQLHSSVSKKRKRVDSSEPILLPKSSISNHTNQCCSSRPDSSKNSVSTSTAFEFPDQIPSVSLSNGFSSDEKKEEIVESQTIKKKRKICEASSVDAAKMPSTEEIEEIFSVAEKLEMKRFLDKYNYDIVKDVALEGRYRWVCLKP